MKRMATGSLTRQMPRAKVVGSPSEGPKLAGRKRLPQTREIRRTMAGKLGSRLEALAEAKHLSPRQFGDKIGKSEATITAYYRGLRTPHIDDWPAIAKALGLDNIRDLLPE